MKLFYRLSENSNLQLAAIRSQLTQSDLRHIEEVELNFEAIGTPDSKLLHELLQLRILLRRNEVALKVTNLNESSRRIFINASMGAFCT